MALADYGAHPRVPGDLPHASAVPERCRVPVLQKLIAGDFANGLLAVLLVLALSFLGAILGGLCGRLYHRRVDKYPSDQVAREDA